MPFDSPQTMIKELAGLPLTLLFAMFIAEQLPISETKLATAVGKTRKTTRGHLQKLEQHDLIFHTRRYRGWGLQPAALQLPLRFMLNGMDKEITDGRDFVIVIPANSTGRVKITPPDKLSTTGGVTFTPPESYPQSYPQLEDTGRVIITPPRTNNLKKPDPFYNQIDRQIDRDNIYNSDSLRFLETLGIDGNLQAMAHGKAHETLGAWYQSQWADNPPALLAKHLLDNRPFDLRYVALAEWRIKAGNTAVEQLVKLLRFDVVNPELRDLPHGVTLVMYGAAIKVYKKLGDIPLW